ncbi:MAG TPA: choice-of-anchor tandem repeat GloVer-containing protein [Rhizomicrobium sp.]|nr:choice-of-anchor tandem repeat GloVer-containing protein [Rhizomicrobium sp.]
MAQETLLYSFNPQGNGNPEARLLLQKKSLFGTAAGLGNSYGTVFELKRSGGAWADSVLYSFAGASDGQHPAAGLATDSSGALYGTTLDGGASG